MGSSSGLDLNFLQSMAVFTLLGTNPPAKLEGTGRALSDAAFGVKHISAEHSKLL